MTLESCPDCVAKQCIIDNLQKRNIELESQLKKLKEQHDRWENEASAMSNGLAAVALALNGKPLGSLNKCEYVVIAQEVAEKLNSSSKVVKAAEEWFGKYRNSMTTGDVAIISGQILLGIGPNYL